MRQSRKQRLLKKRARIQRVALLSYVLILATAGTAWIVMARAAANCTDAAPCAEAGSPVAAANWSLRFADEFNGNAVDLANWNTGRNAPTTTADEPFNGSHEAAYFTSDNVSVGGGLATIQLQAARRTIGGVTYRYSSGELNTLGKLALKPGDYIEARIKVPKCNGCWPAFWTVPSMGSPPPEFDIFEFFNTALRGRPSFNYHFANHTETGIASYGEAGADYRNAFHTYGLYWTGASAIPFLDGRPYPVGVGATTSIPEHILLNLSVYSGFAPAASQMQIDWVRVWSPAAPVVSLASVTSPTSAPTPAPTPAAGPSRPVPTPAPAGQSATIVTGRFRIDVPTGTVRQKILVDGTVVTTGRQLDTRWLLNGEHIVTVQATASDGHVATVTTRILVNNRLNLIELARNAFFSPFRGNQGMISLASVVLSLITLTGVSLVWWVVIPHPRTRAIGLSI